MNQQTRIAPARRIRLLAGPSVICIVSALATAAMAEAAGGGSGDHSADVSEVVVTGTLLGNIRQEDRASPVVSIDAKALEQTGVSSIGDLTRFLPQNVGSVGGMQDLAKGGADTRDTRSANLRGLGAGATLVLLNGRRVTPQGGDDFVNLNSLTPDIAVSRIETVLDGASATYGADAVAGVFNVITNTRFEGLKFSAQGTGIEKSGSDSIQAMWGLGNERMHSVTSVSYRFVDNLQNADRDVTNFFNPSGSGFPGRFVLLGRPLNPSGGDVIINGNDYTALFDAKSAGGKLTVVDPNCGKAGTQSQYVPAAGATFGLGSCNYNYQPKNPIRPRSTSINLHNDTTYEIAPNQTLFAEISYYHQDSKRFGVPSYAQNAGSATMPASNPYNPFGVAAQFIGRSIGAEGFPGGYNSRIMADTVDQQHYVVGLRGDLFADWKYTANATYSSSHTIARDKDADMNLVQAALNGFGGPNCNIQFNGAGGGAVPGAGNCFYYSPLEANLGQLNPALLSNLESDVSSDFKREYYIAEAVVNGPLVTIAGHPIDAAVGVQYRKEMSSAGYSSLLLSGFAGFLGKHVDTSFDRTVKSVFAEANYEVIDGLNVDAAARYEDYGGFQTTAPKIAVNWRVLPEFSLRASASKAFQAPSIANGSNGLISTAVVNVTDPTKTPPDSTFRSVQTYGNPSLQPQTADVFNVGATYLPVASARLSLDYWNYKYKNQIGVQSPQAVVNANPNGPNVIRDASGLIQTVVVTSFNAPSGTETSGVDFSGSYRFDVGPVGVTLRDSLTYLIDYQIDTGVPLAKNPKQTLVYNGVGYRNNFVQSPLSAAAAPRWRSVAGADFSYGKQTVSTTWRYTSGVLDDYGLGLNTTGAGAVTPAVASRIKAFSVFDIQYAIAFGKDDRYEFTAGLINAFNTEPGFAKFNGYLPTISDPFGRQIYGKVTATF